jgi:hypothetical protein
MHENPYSQSNVATPFARQFTFSSPGRPPAALTT